MIRSRDTDSLLGRTGDPTKDNGKMASRTAGGCLFPRKESRRPVFGVMAKRLDGLNELISYLFDVSVLDDWTRHSPSEHFELL